MARKKKLTLEEYRKLNNITKVEVKEDSVLPDTIEELKPDTSIKSSLFTRKSIIDFKPPSNSSFTETRQSIDSSEFTRTNIAVLQSNQDKPKYFDDMEDTKQKESTKISFERKAKDNMESREYKEGGSISFKRQTKDDLDVNKLKSSHFTRKSIVEIKKENQPDAIKIEDGQNGMDLFKNL